MEIIKVEKSTEDEELLSIGQLLKELREGQGVSQKEIATRVGISAPYLGRIENRLRKGSVTTLMAIAAALDISPPESIFAQLRPGSGGKTKTSGEYVYIPNLPSEVIEKIKEYITDQMELHYSKIELSNLQFEKLLNSSGQLTRNLAPEELKKYQPLLDRIKVAQKLSELNSQPPDEASENDNQEQ